MSASGKRKFTEAELSEDDDESEHHAAGADGDDDGLDDDGGVDDLADLSEEDILALVDAAPEVPALDLAGLRAHAQTLERAIAKNQQLRIKHADDPAKFMESELALDAAIKTLHELATQPSLYAAFAQLGGVEHLIGLLAHENNDIASAAVVLLRDLTEPDAFAAAASANDDEGEGADAAGGGGGDAHALLDAVLQPAHLELLVSNLDRLDESYADDAQAVFNTLSIFENICEVRPAAIAQLVAPFGAHSASGSANQNEVAASPLFAYLLKRVRPPKHDDNRLYASELLAILLGSEDDSSEADSAESSSSFSSSASSASSAEPSHPVRVRFAAAPVYGIVHLVNTLAPFAAADIRSAEEEEFVGNLFDALCSALLHAPNRVALADEAAIGVLIAMLRKSESTRAPALRALDFALAKCPPVCEAFVDAGGLKTLFAVFMLPLPAASAAGRKRAQQKADDERAEHLISVVVQLFTYLSDARYQRLLKKFAENDSEKIERLVEVHDAYTRRLEDSDRKQKQAADDDADDEPESEDERYLRHLDAGLYTLQLTDLALAFVATAGDAETKERVETLLNQRDYGLSDVRRTLQQFAEQSVDGGSGSGGGSGGDESQRALVEGIVKLL